MDLSNKNIIHKNNNGIEYLQFKKLLDYPEVKHAYIIGLDKSFKIFQDESEIEKEKSNLAKRSYKEVCEALNLNYNNLVNTMQEHTDNIKIIDKKINKNSPDFNCYENTDGLITDKKDIILSTINADCILLIFYDPIKKVIANVHSGWRGTMQRISVKTVNKMKEEYGSNPKDIICCMSPSIRKDHFEVDEDLYEKFCEEFKELESEKEYIYKKKDFKINTSETSNYFILKNDEKNIFNSDAKEKWYIDTININRFILQNAGLKPENIIDSGICSVCNKDIIHSYRGHGVDAGRCTLIIQIN